jgi:hypothetical protein
VILFRTFGRKSPENAPLKNHRKMQHQIAINTWENTDFEIEIAINTWENTKTHPKNTKNDPKIVSGAPLGPLGGLLGTLPETRLCLGTLS